MNIEKLLSTKENINIECKLAKNGLPHSLWETYSAFANTFGGTLLLGIEERDGLFIPAGVENPDQMIKDFWNTLNNQQKVSKNILFDRQVYTSVTAAGEL